MISTAYLEQMGEGFGASAYSADGAAEDVWDAFLRAGVFVEAQENDPHVFASGSTATLKIDGEKLVRHPRELDIVLGHMASHQFVKEADALLYVPDGMRDPAVILAHELRKPLAHAKRIPGHSRTTFQFASEYDRYLAAQSETPVLLEDVVTTLGSVNGMARLIPESANRKVRALAYILRGTVNPMYRERVIDEYLLIRNIPNDKHAFIAGLEPWEHELYKPIQKLTKK